MSQQIWIDGQFVNKENATVSVYDHGLLYGDGIFEGIRIYNHRIFKLRTHLKRLYKSAQALRLTIPYTLEQIETYTRQTVEKNGLTDGYIRLLVTRGVGDLSLNPFSCPKASVIIIAAKVALYPPQAYTTGLEVITSSVIRNHPAALSPKVKSLNYLNNILAKMDAIDAGVGEAIMLNHQGNVAEATGDNIFAITHTPQGLSIITPPAHAGTLEGVTMHVVMDLAKKAGINIVRQNLTRHDLHTCDEMFLTGTAAEVIAAVKVDGRIIGDGKPGKITRQLNDLFRELVAQNAPED